MAGVGGKRVGRVSIRAVPDSATFRRDLKKSLDRIERSMSVSIEAKADTSSAESALRRFQKDWDGRKVKLAADVNAKAARGFLSVLTRPRIVELITKVNKGAALKAATIIASLSGARLAGDLVERLSNSLQNLDRALPKIALVSNSIAGLTSILLSGVGGIFTLGSGLTSILGILAAAPGILGGAAVGGLAFALALADIPTQLATLKPGFVRLQDAVSAKFWAQARQPILDFVRGTLPEFQTGLTATATEVGKWSSRIVSSLGDAFGGGRITAMFQPLLESIQIASTGANGFAQALAVLGQVGGSYLPRLAQFVADLSNQFGAYLLRVEQSGELVTIINAGIEAAKQFASSLASLASIWSGISDAAMAAGGGGLAAFASTLATIAAIVNSPEFQSTLTTLFAGASVGASGLAASLGPIGSMLTALAPTIAEILSSSGTVVGAVLGEIASALSSPVFATGLSEFFSGILAGIQAVAPALPALAGAFGSFLSFVGKLAATLGPVLGAVLTALAPIFTSILTAIEPLLPILGDGLVSVVGALAPVLQQLITTLLPPIVELISALIPILLPIVSAILPIISALLPVVASVISALIPILTPILSVLTPIAELLGTILAPVLELLSPLIDIFGGYLSILAEILGGVLKTALLLISGLLTGDFSGAVESIGAIWGSVWTTIQNTFKSTFDSINAFGKSAFNILIGALEGLVNGLISLLNGLVSGVNEVLAGLSAASGGTINLTIAKIPTISIPRLAVGADILATPGGVLARLGEGGKAERVIDRGLGNKALELSNALAERVLASEGGAERGLRDVTLVNPDPYVLLDMLNQELDGKLRMKT